MLEGEKVEKGLDDPVFKDDISCFKKHFVTIVVALSLVIIILVIVLIVSLSKGGDDDDKDDPIKVLKTDTKFSKPNIAYDAEFQLIKTSNGMTGLLVSDPYAKVSKVWFRVENGYLMDTVDGLSLLANFMIFYGSNEQFPSYTNIKRFKGLKGFVESLYTDRAQQAYFYETENNYKFEESIKLLAESFRYPKFEENTIKETIQTINHEFYEGINDQYFLLEDTIRQLSSKETSFNGFGCGTNETLKPSESDKLAKKLKGYHMEVNKPENVFFVLYSNQTVEELENYVKKYFTYKMHEFPKSEIDKDDQDKLKNNIENLKKKEIFDENLYGHGFYYNSNLKQNLLNIFFYMGDIDFKGLQFNLVEYISYLFNSQSLLEKLKNYDEKKIKNHLNKLSFEKSFFAFNSERDLSRIETIFDPPETKTLKFYKSEYIYGKIPDGFKDKIDSVEGLSFRTTNKYFSNLDKKVTPCYKEKKNKCKELNEFDIKDDKYSGIRLEDNYETYYQIDKSSESSIVNSYLEFNFPENETIEEDYSIPILKMYFNHIISEINELNSVYDLEITNSKIALKIRSFTDNTKLIIQNLVEKFKSSPIRNNFEYAKGSYKAQIVAIKFTYFQQYVFNLGNKLKNHGEADSTNYGEIIENLYNFEFKDFEDIYNYILNNIKSFTFKIAGNIDKNLVQEIHNFLKKEITPTDNLELPTTRQLEEEKLRTTVEPFVTNYYEQSKIEREVENGLLVMYEIDEEYQKYMNVLTGCLESIFWEHLRYKKSNTYKPVVQYMDNTLYIYEQGNYKDIPQMEDDLNAVLDDMLKEKIQCEHYTDIVDSYELEGNNKIEKTPSYLFNKWINGNLGNTINLRKTKEEEDPYAQIDECESTYNPKGWNECKGKKTYTNEWTCCFFDGKRPTEPNQTYCADVWTTDLNSRERRREVEKNITNGNYWAWDDYQAPFILKNMICSDNDVDKLPSTFKGFIKEISPIFLEPYRYTILFVRGDISEEDYNNMFNERRTNNEKYLLNDTITITHTQDITS